MPEPAGKTAPKSRGSRIISQYAGATIESFGELAPLVTEVLAIDGFGTETKAFTKALETLAMWRATLGEDALAHGLRIAVDKRIGHRYAGGVARRYDPTEEGPRTPRAAAAAELPDDGPPTRLQLVAEGLAEPIRPEDIPPWERPPTHSLYRPRLQAV